MLSIKYSDAANERLGRDVFAMLPNDISSHFRGIAVFNLVANVDMSTVEMLFLPMLLHGNHWGLRVFNVRDCTVEYDDGFHYPVNSFVQELSGKTLKVIFETTGLQHFQRTNWNKVQRFRVPMPDQPIGSGSCGVGVMFCVRDLCNLVFFRRKDSPLCYFEDWLISGIFLRFLISPLNFTAHNLAATAKLTNRIIGK